MKYNRSVYEDFGAFLAQALEITKEKVSIYNATLKAMERGRTDEEVVNIVIFILRRIGWYLFAAIAGLIALGVIGFYGGIAALIAANPALAAILAVGTGASVYIIWDNREFITASKKVGDRYKKDFELIVTEIQDLQTRARPIEKLLDKCIVNLCREAFNTNYDSVAYLLEDNKKSQLERTKVVLILASNPEGSTKLQLDKEVREISSGVKWATGAVKYEVKSEWAVRVSDFRKAVLAHQPEFIHFCGHGIEYQGIVLENDEGKIVIVDAETLANFFRLFSVCGLECVVLNACYSEAQAEAISEHINYVIGVKDNILDEAAITFSTAFYEAIVSGRDILFAHDFGCNAIKLANIPQFLMPVIKRKSQEKNSE
ncbi:MAG: CHAT domain-containing protein [Caldilineaceae bacterium]